MKLTDDEFEYLLEAALQCVGRVDGVAYNEALRIAGFVLNKTALEPVIDDLLDTRQALASLITSLGLWYAGYDGHEQGVLNTAATLAVLMDKQLDEYHRPAHQTLWKD